MLTVGELGAQSCDKIHTIIEVPGVLSFLAYDNFITPVKGIQTLVPEYEAKYGTNLPPDSPLYGGRAGQKIDYLPLPRVSLLGLPRHDRSGRQSSFPSTSTHCGLPVRRAWALGPESSC